MKNKTRCIKDLAERALWKVEPTYWTALYFVPRFLKPMAKRFMLWCVIMSYWCLKRLDKK